MISFGNELNMPSSFGLQTTYKVTPPTGYSGYFGANQLLNYTTTVVPQPSPTPGNTNGAYELDGCPIYTTYWDAAETPPDIEQAPVPTASSGTAATFATVDAPNSGRLFDPIQSEREHDAFIDTLMFKATGGPNGAITDSIWVPLESYAWYFDGTAVENSGVYAWASPSPAPTQYPAAGTYSTTSSPEPVIFTKPGNFPSWNSVFPAPSGTCPPTA
jgi:hypothetical protein